MEFCKPFSLQINNASDINERCDMGDKQQPKLLICGNEIDGNRVVAERVSDD